jgi:diadenosine tetraphosphate (Ap4A) HIT family hydrolase
MNGDGCVFCDLTQFRAADVCIENAHCLYASTRDPRDPPDVLPGCGVIIPIAHRMSPFDFTAEEWEATHELLLTAKAAQDERLAPDGYTLVWNCFSELGEPMHHAHLHVIPRFDDEPLAEMGGRSAIKVPENRRPDPSRRGNGRARSFPRGACADSFYFCQTETCLVLSPVNASRFQPPQRSRSVMPASLAIRSSSDGHT